MFRVKSEIYCFFSPLCSPKCEKSIPVSTYFYYKKDESNQCQSYCPTLITRNLSFTMVDHCNDPASPLYSSCDTVYFSKTASILASCTGALVATSSLLIIIVILRSLFSLSTVYHRLMFGMNSMELIGSLAKSLSTIPMPRDQMYPFHGRALGTVRTCEIQGFLSLLGTLGPNLYFCGLCVFYLCMIELRTDDRKIRKCIEPIIHLVGILLPMMTCVSWFVFFFLFLLLCHYLTAFRNVFCSGEVHIVIYIIF